MVKRNKIKKEPGGKRKRQKRDPASTVNTRFLSKEFPDSSLLHKADYYPEKRELVVYLGESRVYRYSEVPPETYSELLKAESAGSFYRTKIRDVFLCHVERA